MSIPSRGSWKKPKAIEGQENGPKDTFLDCYLELPDMKHEFRMNGEQYSSNESKRGKPPILRLFEDHIQQYSTRQLTYDSDALDAIRSILDRFLNEKFAIDHLCGIPFQRMAGVKYTFQFGTDYRKSSFDLPYGLSWTHGMPSAAPLRRKTAWFPSWSWAGWVGSVTWLPSSTLTGAITFRDTLYSGIYRSPAESSTKFLNVSYINHGQKRGSGTYEMGSMATQDWRSREHKMMKIIGLSIVARTIEVQFHHPWAPLPKAHEELRDKEYYLNMGHDWVTDLCRLHLTWWEIPQFTTRKFKAIELGDNTEHEETYLLVIGLFMFQTQGGVIEGNPGSCAYPAGGWEEATIIDEDQIDINSDGTEYPW